MPSLETVFASPRLRRSIRSAAGAVPNAVLGDSVCVSKNKKVVAAQACLFPAVAQAGQEVFSFLRILKLHQMLIDANNPPLFEGQLEI